MSMRWCVPNAVELQAGTPPPVWLYLALYLLIELIAVALTVLLWPKGQSTLSGEFWLDVFVAPTLLAIGLSCVVYSKAAEILQCKANWWNLLCQNRFSRWQHWARAHLVLLDSAVLTAEKDLAQRMLGLEPPPPLNPENALQLIGFEAAVNKGRQEQVIERLFTSVADTIKRASPKSSLEVLLHAADEDQKVSVANLWRKLELPGQPQIKYLSLDAELPLLNTWFSEQESPDFRLVIAFQLHDGEHTSEFSEAAVAMLFTTPTVFARSKDLKARACIMRPIFAEPDTVDAALTTLLRAEQAPKKKVRQLWFTRLDKLMKIATVGAARDAELSVREQDLDRAIGLPGPVTAWLIQALAAKMVQHNQGAQLITTRQRNGAALNLVSVVPPPVSYPQEQDVLLLSVAWAFGMFFLSLSCFACIKPCRA
jgi:hypothetical protein